MSAPKKFSWKAFVTFSVIFAFLVLGVSGVVLYVAPPGRIANWSIWRLVALTKAQWQAVHTIFGLGFLIAAALHVYFNWKVLVAYVKTKLHEGIRMKWELTAASGLGVALLALTIAGVPPFSTVMDLGDDLKNAWAVPAAEPPIPHAEELTLDRLAETVKLPADQVRQTLTQRGVRVDEPTMTVGQIAQANGLTPQQVFEKMQSGDTKATLPAFSGGGWGRKTVEQICTQYGVPLQTGLERLAAAGFSATGSTTLKDLALSAGKTPLDIAKVIAGPDAAIAEPVTHQPDQRR